MKNICALLILFFGFQAFQPVKAQVTQPAEIDTNTYVIIRNNGKELIGKIVSDDGREVLIDTYELGKIFVPKYDIRSIKKVDVTKDIVNGEYRSRGPFTTRYQFTTNAFPIEKGENYAVVNLYGPEVQFSITNRFSIGVLSTWIASPIALALKYTFPTSNDKLNFGVGTILGSSGYFNQARSFGGLHWGMVTYGDRMNNLTLSLGYSYLRTGANFGTNLYKPGTYAAVEDQFNPGYYTFANLPVMNSGKYSPRIGAPIIGLGGIASVGTKASFIFDAMLILGNIKNYSYTQDVINNYDLQTGYPSSTFVGEVQTGNIEKIKSTNLVLMPGMRFQKTPNEAFQVSLAGIIGATDGERYSFPIPMCSWFFKF
jgi:hypothetical protein